MKGPYKGRFRVSQQFKGAAHDGLDLVGIDSKNIYSTINGTVERAGWENAADKKQGFGLYVRIKEQNSTDRYYFGHLSAVNVKVGQEVKIGELLGIEGSTGYSTGSHCHYCARGNASKSLIRNINTISGIPNTLGSYTSSLSSSTAASKTVSELAQEVLAGKWGNGEERRQNLSAAGYDYNSVQSEVNRLAAAPKKTNIDIAREVIAGKWGNGADRKKRLSAAGYNYSTIQGIVNKLL